MAPRAPTSLWVVDPDDPRAPPTEIWNAMTPEERKHVEDSLPGARELSVSRRRFADNLDQGLTAARERVAEQARLCAEAEAYLAEQARLRTETEARLASALAEIARLQAEIEARRGRSRKE